MTNDDAHRLSTSRSLPIALLRARESVMGSFRELLAEAGISEQKWRVLRVLSEGGPVEQTKIAEQACLLLPSLTRILSAMEKEGLISRERDSSDRRKTIVELADAGEALIRKHSEESAQISADIEARFGADRLKTLLDMLEDLNKL